MTEPSPARATTRRRLAAGAGLLIGGAAALAVAWVLGSWAVGHVTSTRLWRVEDVVAPGVVALGTVAAVWVGASSLVAGACAVLRGTGSAWRAGEAAVQRWAPALVRRALAVTLAAGVGLGTAVGAHATAAAPPADLGWTPTAHAPLAAGTAATPAPEASSPDATGTGPAGAATTAPVLVDVAPATGTVLGAHDTAPEVDDPATGAVPDGTAPTTEPTTDPGTGGTTADPSPWPDPPLAGDAPAAAPPAHATAPSVPTPVAAPLSPLAPAGPGAPRDAAPPAAPTGSVVVAPGDTLWGIAARALGPDATDAEIAAAWPRWYAANASTIGPDPDVLHPGQVLVVPPTTDGGTR